MSMSRIPGILPVNVILSRLERNRCDDDTVIRVRVGHEQETLKLFKPSAAAIGSQ